MIYFFYFLNHIFVPGTAYRCENKLIIKNLPSLTRLSARIVRQVDEFSALLIRLWVFADNNRTRSVKTTFIICYIIDYQMAIKVKLSLI